MTIFSVRGSLLVGALWLGINQLSYAQANITLEGVSSAFETQGFDTEIIGADYILVETDSHQFLATLRGTDNDLTLISFSPVAANSMSYEDMSSFNREVKFGRVYFDTDGEVVLQMDRNANGGITQDNISSDAATFVLLLDKLKADYAD